MSSGVLKTIQIFLIKILTTPINFYSNLWAMTLFIFIHALRTPWTEFMPIIFESHKIKDGLPFDALLIYILVILPSICIRNLDSWRWLESFAFMSKQMAFI